MVFSVKVLIRKWWFPQLHAGQEGAHSPPTSSPSNGLRPQVLVNSVDFLDSNLVTLLKVHQDPSH